VPLALRLLKSAGAAPLEEQRWFWWSIEQLEHHMDLLDDLDDPANSDFPFDRGTTGIVQRREALRDLWPKSDDVDGADSG
jgi:hypothetical protein